jgi:hypothetical protein
MKETSKSKSLLLGALGMLMFAAAWEVIGSYRLAGLSWPPLSTVVAYLTDPTHTSLVWGFVCQGGAAKGLSACSLLEFVCNSGANSSFFGRNRLRPAITLRH